MVEKFDYFLISFYQSLVDFFQKKPVWWVRQIAHGFLVLTLLLTLFGTETAFQVVINSAVTAIFYAYSRSEAETASLGSAGWIRVLIFMLCFWAAFLDSFWAEPTAGLSIAREILFFSAYYFGACKPPKPKVPKTKFAMGGT